MTTEAPLSPEDPCTLSVKRKCANNISDITENAFANALFFIDAKHRHVQRKLHSHLDRIISQDRDHEEVKALPYIDDIISETLRLKPPTIQGLPRETPPQGTHVGTMYIPGHVVGSVPTTLVQRNPRWWKH
jgi:cytochrome P450